MGLSVWHLVILLVIVLLVFGPSRLGDLGKSMGQAIRGFKKGLNEDSEIDVTDSTQKDQLHKGRESKAESGTESKSKEKV